MANLTLYEKIQKNIELKKTTEKGGCLINRGGGKSKQAESSRDIADCRQK